MLFQTKVLLFVKLPLFFFITRLNFHLKCQKIFCCQFVLIHKALFFFCFFFSSHKSRVFYANRHYYTKGQYLFI